MFLESVITRHIVEICDEDSLFKLDVIMPSAVLTNVSESVNSGSKFAAYLIEHAGFPGSWGVALGASMAGTLVGCRETPGVQEILDSSRMVYMTFSVMLFDNESKMAVQFSLRR